MKNNKFVVDKYAAGLHLAKVIARSNQYGASHQVGRKFANSARYTQLAAKAAFFTMSLVTGTNASSLPVSTNRSIDLVELTTGENWKLTDDPNGTVLPIRVSTGNMSSASSVRRHYKPGKRR